MGSRQRSVVTTSARTTIPAVISMTDAVRSTRRTTRFSPLSPPDVDPACLPTSSLKPDPRLALSKTIPEDPAPKRAVSPEGQPHCLWGSPQRCFHARLVVLPTLPRSSALPRSRSESVKSLPPWALSCSIVRQPPRPFS